MRYEFIIQYYQSCHDVQDLCTKLSNTKAAVVSFICARPCVWYLKIASVSCVSWLGACWSGWQNLQVCQTYCLANVITLWSSLLTIPEHDMSCVMTKPTKWHVRPAKTQISLGIHPVWSESSLSAWRKLGSLAPIERTAKTLIRLGRCPGWSESLLGAHAILLVLSCYGSHVMYHDNHQWSACG